MNNEQVVRMGYHLADVIEKSHPRFDETVAAFCRAVEKMTRVAGMQAENDQRKAVGASMAYTESDFANA